MQKFFVLDGNSLIHRAFYALPLLSNRQGVFTNAVLGFTNMLFKLLREEKPDYIAVAFDKGRTFRHDEFKEYKAHRKATPEELRPQFGLIKNILEALNIKIYEHEGYEADDILGTLARLAEEDGLESTIVTGDHDALQLVTPHTRVMVTKKGITEIASCDLNEIKEKYQLSPRQLIDVKALMGDPSDNIPGVPGIGEKTATKLIKEYETIENLMDNLDQLSSKKMAEKLREFKDEIYLGQRLVTIDRNVQVDEGPLACEYREPDYDQLLKIFDKLDFKRLTKEVLEDMGKAADSEGLSLDQAAEDYIEIREEADFRSSLGEILDCQVAALHPIYKEENPNMQTRILYLGIATDKGAYVINFDEGDEDVLLGILRQVFESEKPDIVLHDSKLLRKVLARKGIDMGFVLDDTMIAAYLLDPSASKYDLQGLIMEYMDQPVVDSEDLATRAAQYAQFILKLREVLTGKLKAFGLLGLYCDLELPLSRVLARMEMRGVKVDPEILHEMSQELGEKIDGVTKEIHRLTGVEFNINSPKQLGEVLFDKLKLPARKKTKTGYSTSASVLEDLIPEHEVINWVLDYRKMVKLKSTYVDGLYKLIDEETGRIHTTFNQTITSTGRLSSTEPNLQNIPVRMEMGRKIRKVFVPKDRERLFLAADYSQIELRVLAHLSKDENLMEAFFEGKDIHTRTASEIMHTAEDNVDANMRRIAKAVNFGIIYGISDFGLARDLGISRNEAGKFIDLYFNRYPGVKKYMDKSIASARENGYVTTILNRRRYLPDIFSPNRSVRNFGERTALNTPIQGSAADIIKLAMLAVESELAEQGLDTEMVLQVHDELIFEVPKNELEEAANVVKDCMENNFKLDVPLVVDIKQGTNWYEMKELK